MDLGTDVPALLLGHPLVERVELGGSRAEGTAFELSDWDFIVETPDLTRLACELPQLVEPLHPLAAQWDRYSRNPCYMLMLRGPAKVDLIFGDENQEWAPAWEPSAETLIAIDVHFWDWVLWLEQKRRGGKQDVVTKSLGDMYVLMLEPMGAESRPSSVAEALRLFLDLRERLEAKYGVEVPRELEREVLPVLVETTRKRRSD